MSDLLLRIQTDAFARQQAKSQEAERSLASLKNWLDDLNRNTLVRAHLYAAKPEDRAELLHMQYHHKTYDDKFDPEEALKRTHEYFGYLLILCDGDEDLLMREHGESLDRIIPIHNDRFRWAPKFTKHEGSETVQYTWARAGSYSISVEIVEVSKSDTLEFPE